MRSLIWLMVLLLYFQGGFAQNLHERTWFFGVGNALYFDNGVSVSGGIPLSPQGSVAFDNYKLDNAINRTSIAVSDQHGDLEFFVQIPSGNTRNALGLKWTYQSIKIFDRKGYPFPHGNISCNTSAGNSYPSVIPHPGDSNLYYLIYTHNSGLLYSLVDMQLNSGMGDIVVEEKDVPLTGYGEVIGIKTTTVGGCHQNVWLIARSRIGNQYLSFEVTPEGIQTNPVVSTCGNADITDYFGGGVRSGFLKASHDGRMLATGTERGIELYDFEPCSGRLKHARILDTVPAMGLCFSPDDSKLYASYNKRWRIWYQGEIYQYDLGAGTLSAIAASRTLVMRNPIYEFITILGPRYSTGPLGAMKIGLDNKLYVSKNNDYQYHHLCSIYYPGSGNNPVPAPTNNNCYQGQFMHVIHDPDLAGAACNAEFDFLKLNDYMMEPGLLLHQDISAALPTGPDTLPGQTFSISACFRADQLLEADTAGSCYYWDDGSSDATRRVTEPGTYWVRYFKHCYVQTDTFIVAFIDLPKLPVLQFACPGEGSLHVKQPEGSQHLYSYVLRKEAGRLVDSVAIDSDYTIDGLDTGPYQLQIRSGPCDTTLTVVIEAYPLPELQVHPEDTTIFYGDQVQLSVEGASVYAWWPTRYLDTTISSQPLAAPIQPTEYVVLGINAYGCRDTGRAFIDINYSMPQWLPNAFSPNGDGVNDRFSLQGLRFQKLHVFRIYNRYGNLIFETRDPEQGWDGSFKGQAAETGTYFYHVELVRPDGQLSRLKGEVLLLR